MSFPKARNGKVYGRTRSTRKENVAVYCDAQGWTRVDVWTVHERQGTIRMTTSAARVLRKAIDAYLEAQ